MIKIIERPLPCFNDRPDTAEINVVIVHAMHADEFPGAELDPQACWEQLKSKQVAAHYLIAQSGEIWRLVGEEKRAWHAGESQMPAHLTGAAGVNDFSIGVELVGYETQEYTAAQYQSFAELTADILKRHPLRAILGHEHIAIPAGRKTDPGPFFSWPRYREALHRLGVDTEEICFGD
ncbi:MAG TPA: N-acetylmuramoyl-L-alanine amidase [Oligoflexia bacterium]|nr:N-acetylmuramoyl-L-alanine amidase [Oligoflexia bacterium]